MNREVGQLWVDALRSGKYKQGRAHLGATTGHYCCFGVLCELAVAAGAIPPPVSTKTPDGTLWSFKDCTEMPPLEVLDWAGINHDLGPWEPDRSLSLMNLANMNDQGKTFAEIAAVIERNWLSEDSSAN